MANLVCVEDYEKYCKKILSKAKYEFFEDGSGQQETCKNNKNIFRRYRIRPRYLRNVEKRTMNRNILGKNVSMPIGISPTAIQKFAHDDGEIAMVKAAEQLDTIYILSSHSTTSIEDVTKAAPRCRKWLQSYVFKAREITVDLVATAEKAGFEAIVLTCDFPVLGIRLSTVRNKLKLPSHLHEAVLQKHLDKGIIPDAVLIGDASADWSYIKWLTTITRLPIIAKGILTADDAISAVEAGVSAILVSNHGGRQLDGLPSTLEALPEIVKAVGHKVEVYMDGGIRDGTDVFKALALGAKMIFVGRAPIWGLAHSGEQGVKNILSILKNELDKALAISGCASLDEVTSERVVHESYYSKI